MRGQFNLTNIMGIIVVVIFLAAVMPTLITAQTGLQASVAGYPVEVTLAGLVILFVIISFLAYIANFGQQRQQVSY